MIMTFIKQFNAYWQINGNDNLYDYLNIVVCKI